uniref:Photosystem I assembly protein Ycf4 n=1 Tax=Colacium vesiculosum TaxID=102910 RepID=I6NJW0_9EUGL|nr:photosystem I assembly protein ycf4 [Colacium vesiculosum]
MIKNDFNSLEKKKTNMLPSENILIEKITEPNKNIKYLLNTILLSGALGFLTVGISSYLRFNIIAFLDSNQIVFFPQGITMCFYGLIGVILSINQFLILYLKIGEGYNEFNKETGMMTIYRKGFLGKDSDINIVHSLKDIEAVKLEVKTELFNTKQNIFICIKGKRDLPIIQISEPIQLSKIEEKATDLADFLKVVVKS